MTAMHIVFSRFSAFYSPLIATFSNGYLAAEGFEVTYGTPPTGANAPGMVLDGAATVAQSAVSQGFMEHERGAPHRVKHFAQINEMDGFFVAGREAASDFNWQNLAGRRVLVDHAGQPMAMFKYGCHRAGLDYASIEVIDAGEPAAMEAAFRAGEGDFIQLQGPAPQQMEVEGLGYVLASVGEQVGTCAFSSIIATPEWLATEDARAFMRAYRAARAFVIESPAAEVAAAVSSCFDGVAPEALTRTIAAYQALGCWPPHIEITDAAWAGALDVFEHSALISERFGPEGIVAAAPG
jgi:NitT/TauT family transport system substrate-binding protein